MSTVCSLRPLSMYNYEEVKITLQKYEELKLCCEKSIYPDLKQDLMERLNNLKQLITKAINNRSEEGETPLLTAARIGDCQTLQRLLDHDAEIKGHTIDSCGTVLHYSIKYQSYDCIKEIIQKKPELLNERDLQNLSPFQYSKNVTEFNNEELRERLKNNIENFSMKNIQEIKKTFKKLDELLNQQKAAQDKIQMQKLQEPINTLREIIKTGLNGPDDRCGTPLHAAAFNGDLITLRRLLELDADISICEPQFNASLLHVAVAGQNTACVLEILTKAPHLVHTRNNLGYSPFQYSNSLPSIEIRELLKLYSFTF